jgi:hypothetical protein
VSHTPRPLFSRGKRPFSTHWLWGWLGLRVCWELNPSSQVLTCSCRESNPGSPVITFLCWESNPGSPVLTCSCRESNPGSPVITCTCRELNPGSPVLTYPCRESSPGWPVPSPSMSRHSGVRSCSFPAWTPPLQAVMGVLRVGALSFRPMPASPRHDVEIRKEAVVRVLYSTSSARGCRKLRKI